MNFGFFRELIRVFVNFKLCDIDEVGILVFATPRRANDALASKLGELEIHLIGDCMAPRNLMIAIHEGHAVGNAL